MKVVLDIETVQPPKEEWAALAGVDLAMQDDLLEAGEAARQDKEFERAAFDGTFSRIVCIGMLAFSDDMAPQPAVAWDGVHEEELLQQFWDWIGRHRPSPFITPNGPGVGLPFIKKSAIIHQVRPT